MKVSTTTRLNSPPDRVAEVICSEAYNIDAEKLREDVVSTEYKLVEAAEEHRVFEMHSVQYKRKKTGGIDRSGTVLTLIYNEWSGRDHTLRWEYRGRSSNRIKLSGIYRLLPHGSGTRLVHDVEVEVKIPLVGGTIARFIARELERTAGDYHRLIERHLQG